ncbi:hypothetical protein GPECTOR_23g6 [Gonium pectorale]|uniref:Protein kinase domain-containing protein n=1 Tax=Gonium pectorale TaxID=33097 RepID=A0A150GH08_GONPE|nr:hypothetical protein GPECTOR_23g6 [Gonium pectorale]|eukprot:KXZ49131.1 hypothetical protein GPECTOR_23g6 [Gonium pectorale]
MGGVGDIKGSDLKPLRKLGEGAFAVVEEAVYTPPSWEGQDRTPSGKPIAPRRVAVKRLKPAIIDHEGDLESFINEIALLRKLANRRIVEYIGVGSSDLSSEEAKRKSMFLVQEFMDGGTLKKLVSRQMLDMSRHIYSFDDAFRWAVHVAEGLEYLHTSRPVVIHRDLKLENILLKGTDPHMSEAKIADFGLVAIVRPRDRALHEKLEASDAAQLQRQQSVSRSTFMRMMSSRKQLAMSPQEAWDESFKVNQLARMRTLPPQQLSGRTGSYMYMAPEMYRQEAYTEKVDVFSYGVIIFEVCAISIAGTEEEIESYAAKVSRGYRPPLPAAWPEALRRLIAACWEQDPALRPSMAAVKEALARMQAEGVPAEMQKLAIQPMCQCAIC